MKSVAVEPATQTLPALEAADEVAILAPFNLVFATVRHIPGPRAFH